MSSPSPAADDVRGLTRRSLFDRVGTSLYGTALTWLLGRDLFGGTSLSAAESSSASASHHRVFDLKSRPPQFDPKAKAVIQLFMQGGPSHVDLFDPKPALDRHHGESYFDKLAADLTGPETAGALMRSPFRFARHGESGIELSEVLPHLAEVVDDITVIRSMFTTHPNHEPAVLKFQTGQLRPGYPAMGAWVVYGLGSENENLPAYVVLANPVRRLPVGGVQNWQSAFLPPIYQGTRIRSVGAPLLNLTRESSPPDEVVNLEQNLLSRLNRIHHRMHPDQLRLDARISSYQLAAQMQMSAGDALDVDRETAATRALYGLDQKQTENFGRRCLMARRLVERGVRFVQICTQGQIWDNHGSIGPGLRGCCGRTDQPVAALLKDLKQRGLLDSTLVIWGGEFGRMPIAQIASKKNVQNAGRDHNPRGFSLWVAGGGVKGGTVYGATDEVGYKAVENPVSIGDWHATVLHLLGMHDKTLFFPRNGLDERLTSVFPTRVIREILR